MTSEGSPTGPQPSAPPPPPVTTTVVESEWARFLETLAAGGDGVWDLPTRLPGWRVEDLARHVHWGMTLESEGLAGVQSSQRARGRTLTVPRGQILTALRAAHEELVSLLRVTPHEPGATVPMPYGDVPLGLAVHVFAIEAAMHRSDLVHAVHGAAVDLAPAAVPSCALVLQAFWPALAAASTAAPDAGTAIRLMGETVAVAATFDGASWVALTEDPGQRETAPTVVVSGADVPLLMFAYGRLPLAGSGLAVHGDHTLAERFKELVPGP